MISHRSFIVKNIGECVSGSTPEALFRCFIHQRHSVRPRQDAAWFEKHPENNGKTENRIDDGVGQQL